MTHDEAVARSIREIGPGATAAVLRVTDAQIKLADIQAELHELTTNTQAELDRAHDMISMGREDSPDKLFRMALLSERLNVLDDVRRIVGF
jgi:4-hydroxyphenylpyruvate dioxygenase-like putative hemolysin